MINKSDLKNVYFKINNLRNLSQQYKFLDNKKNSENLIVILAGFKEYLWDNVFNRIKRYIDNEEEYDVCLVSSGIFSEKLENIAKQNNWSYLSLKRNNVCLALNTAINIFNNAEYIYKIDEDIFITEKYFQKLKQGYINVEKNSLNTCGFIAPIMPLNGIGYVEILKNYDLINDYEKRFKDKVKYSSAVERQIIKNPEVAEYFWGNKFPVLDEINNDFENKNSNNEYLVSPLLFSIGSILFKRDLWDKMHMFPVSIHGNDMGHDETYINQYCYINSKSIVVLKNTVVGHFAYGPQTNRMKIFMKENLDRF